MSRIAIEMVTVGVDDAECVAIGRDLHAAGPERPFQRDLRLRTRLHPTQRGVESIFAGCDRNSAFERK